MSYIYVGQTYLSLPLSLYIYIYIVLKTASYSRHASQVFSSDGIAINLLSFPRNLSSSKEI